MLFLIDDAAAVATSFDTTTAAFAMELAGLLLPSPLPDFFTAAILVCTYCFKICQCVIHVAYCHVLRYLKVAESNGQFCPIL